MVNCFAVMLAVCGSNPGFINYYSVVLNTLHNTCPLSYSQLRQGLHYMAVYIATRKRPRFSIVF